MSNVLIAAILVLCPGRDHDSKGQVITTECQEQMINCIINKAGNGEPTRKEFEACASDKQRGSVSSGLSGSSETSSK